ncbi:helix-turn-helix transcriptional regulator [Georgenia faecalis]|uniref:Helix-turn-helix transcriptional regulator n=1 Tax=Georgenia faecalis TaxID=2483799 RepID=A0ABV9DDL1_9MICO|nr:helix-turn-helix domain-containing protein [Georgenia faecalis]
MRERDADATTRERVLRLVVERGPVSAAELADLLALTPAGVRRHIAVLEQHGEIAVHGPSGPEQRRRGRPARRYVATDAGRAGLSDAYSDLATHVLGYLRDVAGPQAVEQFAEARVGEIERRYAPAVTGAGEEREDRARALAAALSTDGYAATVRTVGPAGAAVQLCQGNCPVLDVAESFPELCEAETRAFSRILGVHVQRLATLAAGGHVCTTHIPTATLARAPSRVRAPQPSTTSSIDDTEGI